MASTVRSDVGKRRTKAPGNKKYLFGTDDEVSNRDATTHQPAETKFSQIGTAHKGGNANEPSFRRVSGDYKFDDSV